MLRPIKLNYYLSFMREHGVAQEVVLEGTDIDFQRLADPAYIVGADQSTQVVANMMRLTGDRAIGFRVGGHAQLTELGIAGHVIISSNTLRQAVMNWIQFGNLIGMLIDLSLVEQNDGWTIVSSANKPTDQIYSFCVEELLVSGHKVCSTLVETNLAYKEIQLPYPAPAHAHLYERYFDCPVHFDSPRTSITIKNPSLDMPLRSRDEELNAVVRQYCSQMLQQIEAQETLIVSQLRSLFLNRPSTIPSIADAATRLNMSSRTMARRLSEANTNYQEVVNQFRLGLATEYLKSKEVSPKKLGEMLGYSDTNAFRRAFKSWTGKTIGSYCSTIVA